MTLKDQDNPLEVTLPLPKNFRLQIDDVMDDELQIAARKWSVNLDRETKKQIKDHAWKQLLGKIIMVHREEWNPQEDLIKVTVKRPSGGREAIELPKDLQTSTIKGFVRGHDGWQINEEPVKETVLLEDFTHHVQNLMLAWARTAVFYGVGSYHL